jgi:hypothetical protein
MDRKDCAIVVNTCPKYFYILDAHFGLLRRYAKNLKWNVYLATEIPNDTAIQTVKNKYKVTIIPLEESEEDFLESRLAAVNKLPAEINYVLPLQDDFLLERPGVNEEAVKHILEIMDVDKEVLSCRLMPSPPSSAKEGFWGHWKRLMPNDMLFSFQATLWRREVYVNFLQILLKREREKHPKLQGDDWNRYLIQANPAETYVGQNLLEELYPKGIHLCWPREGSWSNAVYLSPWPYRPTAIVKGVLQPWAEELVKREGFTLTLLKNQP